MSKDFMQLDKEARRILSALTGMYLQYCSGPSGHSFMGAGEDAIEVLMEYGLADGEFSGINEKQMNKLQESLTL